MTAADVAVTIVRAVGVLYCVAGSLAGARAVHAWRPLGLVLAPVRIEQRRPSTPAPKPDAAREGWRVMSALLFVFAGAAMVTADESTPTLLAALLVQQMFYFGRQHVLESEAATDAAKSSARPSWISLVAFCLTCFVAVFSGALAFTVEGLLR